uniref:Uncharacterized protein n=1 Tax=Parascaris univalens TaxID=6257 RepID=A0A915AK16_PARUN
APPAHAKSSHNDGIFTSNLSRQRICTCRLGSASRVSVTGSILNIAVSGETSPRSTFSPSLCLSPESELSPSSVSDPSHHDPLDDERRSKNNDDVGICNNLSSPILPPTHNRGARCQCTNGGD